MQWLQFAAGTVVDPTTSRAAVVSRIEARGRRALVPGGNS